MGLPRQRPCPLRNSVLLGLAEEMGQEVAQARGEPLRGSATLAPAKDLLSRPEFQEPHRRGEVLVAAVMNSFLAVWMACIQTLGEIEPGLLHRERVAEEGADVADALLTMAIRAIDYLPPVHLEFGDFLSALLTADVEVRPDDSRDGFRTRLLETFASYGILPATTRSGREPGTWRPPLDSLAYAGAHHESLTRDPDEVFRFVWENRGALGLDESAYTRVLSVRPCLRIAPDGFALRETVAEVVQLLDVKASELAGLHVRKLSGMPQSQRVRLEGGRARLEGGMTLVFDPAAGGEHSSPTGHRRGRRRARLRAMRARTSTSARSRGRPAARLAAIRKASSRIFSPIQRRSSPERASHSRRSASSASARLENSRTTRSPDLPPIRDAHGIFVEHAPAGFNPGRSRGAGRQNPRKQSHHRPHTAGGETACEVRRSPRGRVLSRQPIAAQPVAATPTHSRSAGICLAHSFQREEWVVHSTGNRRPDG